MTDKAIARTAGFSPNASAFPRAGQLLRRLLLGVLLSSVLFSASESRAAQTYFRAQRGEIDASDSVIAAGNFGARRDSISGWQNWVTASSSEESALAASDNIRFISPDAGFGDNSAMIFEYTFNDSQASLDSIDIAIEVAQAWNDDAIYIYIWDYDAGRYDVLGRDSGTSDTLLNFSITSDPAQYLDGSGNLTIFLVNQDSYGSQSSARVDYLNVTLTSSGPHFAISHAGTSSTCDRAEITLTRHDSAHAVVTSYVGMVDLSTSSSEGTWTLITGDGTVTDDGNGDGTYTFAASDNGSVVLGLTHSLAATVDLDVTDGSASEASTEDPSLTFVDPGSLAVRDEFNATSYSGNDGSANWTGSWVEVGESNGVSSNYATVTSGRCASGNCLRIGTSFSSRNTFSNRGARREVNLEGASSATLSFQYLRGYVRGSGSATVSVSRDGGTNFTTIATYSLNGNTSSPVSQSFDISSYISPNTQVRFLATANDSTNSIYVDNIQVAYEIECPAGGSFDLDHDGTGVHCLDEPFTVSALDSSGSPQTSYGETITLTTQTGVGSFASAPGNAGTLTDGTADDGLATYAFAAADGGNASFTLNYSGATGAGATTTIDLDVFESANPVVADDDSEGLLSFAPSAFLITANALTNPVSNPVNDPIGTRIAGDTYPVHISAFGTSASSPACGVIESYSGAKSIRLWTDYANPTTGSRTLSLSGSAISTNGGSPTTLAMTFSLGRASWTAQYRDVGQIRLNANDPSVTEPAGGISGSSDAWTQLPADFEITSVQRPDLSANPGVDVPTGAVFVAAGEPFRATIRAVDVDGNLTPNYGRESSPETIRLLSASLVAPAAGRNGVLNDGAIGNATSASADATAGSFTGTAFSFSEVGAIRLQAGIGDEDYLGAGDRLGSLSGTIGRFTPSRFEVLANTPEFQTACGVGAFTWMDQPFQYTTGNAPTLSLTAVNAAGQTTENYAGSWWRLTNDSLENRAYQVSSATLDLSGLPATSADPAIGSIAAGQGTLTFSAGSGIAVERSTPIAPFTAEIELSIDILDADGVAYAANPFRVGGTTSGAGIAFDVSKRFQFGRLALENAFGSERETLSPNLRPQHFDGTVFTDDTNDSCSLVSEAHLTLTPSPAALSSTAALANQPMLGGDPGLSLTAPNTTGTLAISVNLGSGGANLPWLRFDWPQDGNLDGTYDDDPSAEATFGIWEGREFLIYQQEVY
ncbi:MAG: DUF6701 domain-containing protein [Myxococcota bacterium]